MEKYPPYGRKYAIYVPHQLFAERSGVNRLHAGVGLRFMVFNVVYVI